VSLQLIYITATSVSVVFLVYVCLKYILELTCNIRNQVFSKMKTVCKEYASVPIIPKTIYRWINFKDKNT